MQVLVNAHNLPIIQEPGKKGQGRYDDGFFINKKWQ
jgi:hypothetical protein